MSTSNRICAAMPASPAREVARDEDTSRVERALDWLSGNFERQPSLAEAASHVGWSESHFQRKFRRQVGLSPKKFVQFLTLERAKDALARSRSVLDAAYDAGLSGGGRLHDLFVNVEAMTPGEYKHRGRGLTIRYGMHPSPFGQCLIMRTDRGVGVIDEGGGLEAAAATARRIFGDPAGHGDITLHLRGTPFQIKVWRALLAIPQGCVTSYGELARRVGAPRGARAAGSAVGANPVSWLIPCHRVIRASGVLGEYRWGRGRKLAMLSIETGTAAPPTETPGRTAPEFRRSMA